MIGQEVLFETLRNHLVVTLDDFCHISKSTVRFHEESKEKPSDLPMEILSQ